MSKTPEKKILAAFDFDGTITTRDTMIAFIQFALGSKALLAGYMRLALTLAGYKAGLIKNDVAKQRLLTHFFSGWEKERLIQLGEKFCAELLPGLIRPAAWEHLEWHRNQGHTIICISASLDFWMAPWFRDNNIQLLASVPEYKDGKFTGKLASPNCYGPEKVKRLKEVYNLSEFLEIYAYGDSGGDKELLAIATRPSFKPFRINPGQTS